MSRRKQAKPRPIFAYEDEGSHGHSEELLVPLSQTNGHSRLADGLPDEQDDQDDFEEFAPLVMDTSSHDDPPTPSSVAMTTTASRPRSPPAFSIKQSLGFPPTAQTIRPTPIKALTKPQEPPVITNNNNNQVVLNNNHLENGDRNHSNNNNTVFRRIGSTSSVSSLTSVVSSVCEVPVSGSANLGTSPEKSPSPTSLSVSSAVPSTAESPSSARRGSKPLDDKTDENGENLDYDSDFDDLEELLSELIRDKILPISGEDGEKFICPVCSCSLMTLHELTVHIRSHNAPASGSQSNECKICGKILSSQSSLDRHMLVHSGERPFICKICNMSFTTNGNMHRHSRIHTKEEKFQALGNNKMAAGVRRGKTAWRQRINSFLNQAGAGSPVSDRMKTFPAGLPTDILQTLPNHSQQSMFGRPGDAAAHTAIIPGMKRQYSGGEVISDWSIPYKRQSLESEVDMKQLSPKKYSYHFPGAPAEQEVAATRVQVKQEPMEVPAHDDQGDKEVLHCPACPKTFLCKYGLETHMETHAGASTSCDLCDITFSDARTLRIHHFVAHTNVSKDGETTETKDGKDGKDDDVKEQKIGFHDLSFVDFSVEKFALIAKHYFENNVRIPSSAYLNFTCKVCSKAFPCESSLILHTYSHNKHNSTQCPLCDSDYGDVTGFHTHMLKHLSDRAFEEVRPSLHPEQGDEEAQPERLSQPDFLAMFDLKEDDKPPVKPQSQPPQAQLQQQQQPATPVKKEAPKPASLEKGLNNEYFAKLGQVFANGVPPLFGHFPMFPAGYQPSLDDFHKMLQIATNMSGLPSMGAGLLMQQGPPPATPTSAHSSPSKPAPGSTPQLTPPTPVRSSPVPAHSRQQRDAGLITPIKSSPEDARVNLSGPEKEISEIKLMNSGPFPCKYCDNVFSNYKTLKAHIRTHLGLSPYQCNLCVYSSADKSSLIRHIRTHTGSRPFQCILCNFAFTTRANCERHIRKKHQVTEKSEIEKSIFHNKFSTETSPGSDASFHSPDTVCKYCGVDFRYFRALKNHLRSHSSCSQKPYTCALCDIGFCTKANCLRHIQKMHPLVTDNQIERHIRVYDQVMHGDNNDTDNESSVSDDGIPLFTEDSQMMGFGMIRSETGTPQPPAAHSTPKPDGLIGRDSRHVSPNRHISPMSHLSPTRSPAVVKTEPMDMSESAPLDFSMKAGSEPLGGHKVAGKAGKGEEAPMDLSVKKPTMYQPIVPKPILQKVPLATSSVDGQLLQCLYCPLGYSTIHALERHLRTAHATLLPPAPDTPGSINAALAAQLSNSSASVINNEGKLLLPPKSMTPTLPLNRAKVLHQPRAIKPKSVSATIQNLQDKIKQNLKRDTISRSPSGSETDLSSVTKMMDATDPHNFQAFFNCDQQPSPTLLPAPITKKPPVTTTAPSHLPAILRRPGVQISVEHCKAINRELDNLQREGDVDEVALSQVREMALSVKEECVNSTPATSIPASIALAPAPTLTPATVTTPMTLPTTTHQDLTATAPVEDENSGDGMNCSKSDADKSGENGGVKKKRNSYADSPHKLSCPYCPRAFPWVSSLTRHLLTHTGQKPFKCPRCPVTFSTKSNRERHLIRKHGVNMLDPLSRQTMDRPYKCPLCVFSSFSTQSNLLKHYRDRHNGMNLPESIADIERMSPTAIKAATLEMETRAAENPPQLDDSGLNMTTEEDEEDLDNSLDSSEKIDEDSISYTEMEASEDRADSVSEHSEKSSYSLPLMNDRPLVIADQESYEKQAEQPKIAPHLMMMMPELQRMRYEQQSRELDTQDGREPETVAGDKPRDETASPETLSKNIQRIIAEQKAIIEQKAAMEMKMQAEIRAHIEGQRKPSDDPPLSPASLDSSLVAIDAAKRFTGSAERIINPERDNYDVDKITECWKCKDIFPSRKVLMRHLKEHNIDLPYKCYLCDASYDKRVDCLAHQEDAHGSDWKILKEKNKVGELEQFATHMDKVVENNCNKLDSGSILEIPGTGNDDSKMEVISADYMQRKVYCSLCPKRFWSLQDLRRHMRSHTGERPFECDICQKRFTLKHSMMRHRKKHAGAPPRSFEDDDDSNGLDDKKLLKPSTSRTVPQSVYPSFPLSFSLGGSGVDSLPTAVAGSGSTFLFSRGISGGTLTIGGSPIASLVPASTAGLPTSTLAPATSSLYTPVVSSTAAETRPTPVEGATKAKVGPQKEAAILNSVKKEFLDCSADMLHNLLGVESAAIEKMLDSADSKSAAQYLGLGGEGSSAS